MTRAALVLLIGVATSNSYSVLALAGAVRVPTSYWHFAFNALVLTIAAQALTLLMISTFQRVRSRP